MTIDPSPSVSNKKLGIIAGNGTAPQILFEACVREGRPVFVVALDGHAGEWVNDVPHARVTLGALGRFRDIVTAQGLEQIVMLGGVRRPSLTEIKPDWLGLKSIAKIGLNMLGDDDVLRNVGRVLHEETGVEVVAPQQIFTELLTPHGILTTAQPSAQQKKDILRGVQTARQLGVLDIGQAVVIQDGLVLGVEAIEGTDALIARTSPLRRDGGKPVLVKMAKPQQDHRYDLPSIGLATIEQLQKHNFAGVAMEADKSLFLQRDAAISFANKHQLFILGYRDE